MANTSILLKKSATPGGIPSSLEYGELALNYRDGKLYYKNYSDNIVEISGGAGGSSDSFATINSNSTLILATSSTDTLTFIPGDNISISTDAFDKSITISAAQQFIGDVSATGEISASTLKSLQSIGDEGGEIQLSLANTNTTLNGSSVNIDVYQDKLRFFESGGSNRGYFLDMANAEIGSSTDILGTLSKVQVIFDQANTTLSDITNINGIDATQNTNITIINGIDATQNTNITNVGNYANSAFSSANAAQTIGTDAQIHSNYAYHQANVAYEIASSSSQYANSAFQSANSAAIQAQGAYDSANTKLPLTGGTITGNLNIDGRANVNSQLQVGTGSYVILPNTISQFTGNTALYSQVNQQNIDGHGTADFVVTANNGTDLINYLDMGIAGSEYDNTNYNSWDFVNPNDGFVMLQGNDGQDFGGNLYIGTTGTGQYVSGTEKADIVFIQGSNYEETARFALKQGLIINTNKESYNVATGSLVLHGGAGIDGSVYARNIYDNGQRILDVANNATTYAESAGQYANSAFNTSNNAVLYATSAGQYANSAFSTANGKFSSSGGLISGSANVTGNVTVGTYIDLKNTSLPTKVEGRIFYDTVQHALGYYNESDMTVQIGQESFMRVWNNTGSTITDGKAVCLTNESSDGFPGITLAKANDYETAFVVGVTTTSIPHLGFGYVTVFGKVNGLDTHLFSVGDELYLSAEEMGGLQNTPPPTPALAYRVGRVVTSDVTTGTILVEPMPEYSSNFTTGSIFVANNGLITQDSALFWDVNNHRLGINTQTPNANLHVAGDALFTGNVEIQGNLIISNAQSISTTTLVVEGNEIVLNKSVTDSPTTDAYITINRGTSPNVYIQWDETIDEWRISEASGEVGHIISSAKTANTWEVYAGWPTYEKETHPIGANLANATNQLARSANTTAYVGLAYSLSAGQYANSAYDQANTATSYATSAGQYANSAYDQANTATSYATSAGQYANSAYQKANSITVSFNLTTNSGSGSISSGNTLSVLGNTGIYTYSTGSSLYIENIGVTSLTTGSSSRIGISSTSGDVIVDLATIDGLSAGTYTYPLMQVDAYGRITSISSQSVGGTWIRKTSNYTANVGDNIIADTSNGAFTITLPVTPSLGQSIIVADGGHWAANNLTIARNGSTIEGITDNVTMDISGIEVTFVYDGTTWQVYASIGPEELPSQSGNEGKYLTTNGVTPSWSTVTIPEELPSQSGNEGKYLTTNGVTPSWSTVTLPSGQTSGSVTPGYLQYNGTSKSNGQFDGGTTDPSNTTRLNYDGNFYATKFYGDGSSLSGVGSTVSDDTTTNATRYIVWEDITSGTSTTIGVSSSKLYFNPNTGTLSATIFNSLSDATLKENVAPLDANIDNIKPVEFTWKDNGNKSFGVIAQDIETVFPHIVETNDDGIKSVSYTQIIPILIKEIQELKREIEILKGKK